MGKPIGTYITLEAQGLMDPDEGYHREVSHVIADQIRRLYRIRKTKSPFW